MRSTRNWRGTHERLGAAGASFLLLAIAIAALPSCCYFQGHEPSRGIVVWQDTTPPALSLAEKAAGYRERLEAKHLTPDGLLAYTIHYGRREFGSYGNLADGPFFTGIYLASQAHRYAATGGAPAARDQVLRALAGLRLLMEVTGEHGLLARYLSRTEDVRRSRGELVLPSNWRQSDVRPEYCFRADVSKDQYAGFIHGLGSALALVDDPFVRREVAELSAAAADHLIEHDLEIVDWHGGRTKHGELAGHVAAVPFGPNALIALAIAKVAAVSTGEARYRRFYEDLVAEGYIRAAYWAHVSVAGIGNRVNDNMAHLALYALLLLEDNDRLLEEYWRGEERNWRALRRDGNTFFAFVYAAAARQMGRGESATAREAADSGRDALLEFPEEKIAWPVDLTREQFDFPRRFFNTFRCRPASTESVPLYLRPARSNFWVSDPFRLTGNLRNRGDAEYAGADYLQAYWMGRYYGFVAPGE